VNIHITMDLIFFRVHLGIGNGLRCDFDPLGTVMTLKKPESSALVTRSSSAVAPCPDRQSYFIIASVTGFSVYLFIFITFLPFTKFLFCFENTQQAGVLLLLQENSGVLT
jgi:hypothetical protein